ncbi:MAG: hypothetical protein QOK44_4653 [Betaproteobacteria bacterium]|jgi:hypothetical protein|nr:hypothetical protein [Betaproteobacteria bacterium]
MPITDSVVTGRAPGRPKTYTYDGAGDLLSCGRRLHASNLSFPGQYFDKKTNLHYN